MKIEGEPSRRFKVFRTDIDDNPYECLAEYDTIEQVQAHRWRRRTTATRSGSERGL